MQVSTNCPIPDAHRRLDDAHADWHEALDAYMDPHAFRRKLNAFLQDLRSVVMLIERKKRKLPDGVNKLDAWRTHADERRFYRWGIQSRDLIVHEADLKLNSIAEITLSRLGRDFVIDRFNVTPEVDTDQLLLAMLLSKPSAVKDGLLTVSRRWVTSDLPDDELLAVAAELFATVTSLVELFHNDADACDLDLPQRVCHSHPFERPNCMLELESRVSISIDLETRQRIVARVRSMRSDRDFDPEVARERYGEFFDVAGDPIRAAMPNMRRASLFLTVDSEALPFMSLYKGERVIEVLKVAVGDLAAKISLSRHLAERVRLTGADGFVFVGEMWAGWNNKPDRKVYSHESTYYNIRPERNEMLAVVAAKADGRVVCFYRQFDRDGNGMPVLKEHIHRSFTLPASLKPVAQVWRS